ncbi:hypothetical protein [Microbulbifer sediminum]|uniref:hypothetical protein n=1 Tax=Microbulbifer sediminum TaxID=2904250 RepID=UPI001F46D2F7|nr:hypothetical protein [Microbulbifer sediminum]
MSEPKVKTANRSNGSILLAMLLFGGLHFYLLDKLFAHVGPHDPIKFVAGIVVLLVSFFSILSGLNRFRWGRFKCPDCKRHIGKVETHEKAPGTPIYQFCCGCNILWLVGKAPKRTVASEAGFSFDAGGE